MAASERAPWRVDAIEGIGQKIATRLMAKGVHQATDLSRMRFGDVARAAGKGVSRQEIRAWRSMSRLLWVEQMTPQWAEALTRAGFDSLEALSEQPLYDLILMFRKARAESIIPFEPSLEQVAAMMQDSMRLRYTGWLYGRVVNKPAGKLSGVIVRFGKQNTVTDLQGRFTLTRIPLGTSKQLVFTHPDFDTLIVDEPRIATDERAVTLQTFRMERAGDESARPVVLDQFAGDELPPIGGHRVRADSKPREELRDGDILVLNSTYASGDAVKLVSLHRTFCAGEFVVHHYRVNFSELPPGVTERQHVEYSNGKFTQIEFDPDRHRLQLAKRRFRAKHGTISRPKNNAEFDELIRLQAEFVGKRRTLKVREGGTSK